MANPSTIPTTPSRHHVSECDLPDISQSLAAGATYVPQIEQMSLAEIKAQALGIIADAGLPKMEVAVHQSLGRDDHADYQLFAYEPVFLTIAVSAFAANSPEEVLAVFSKKLGAWARDTKLLPAVQKMEGSLASA
ncbi:hypothetical protein Q5H92_08810 [Hymenobacter sp. M29]|uniref:Uncharacterized protein n=1 Tax=Hymenobacter mellowenesis TaxID=3063995 RepID=A0ABT9AB91_9BACT|nr:hypothetical protein [Hymenobacter sp. M29]MDO7846455.1 hypothetical protein [Hymenobacter sp. M29]